MRKIIVVHLRKYPSYSFALHHTGQLCRELQSEQLEK